MVSATIGLRHHCRSMHEKKFHSIEDSAEITVTIKLITSCNAEHKVKQLRNAAKSCGKSHLPPHYMTS